jgi:hypothetical protein
MKPAEVVGKPRSQGSLLRTLVCLLTCSILHNNNLVDAGCHPYQKGSMSETVECVYSNVKRFTKPWIASL